MIKVLFVDDEPKVLEVLGRALHSQRDRWDMVFATGGAAGIAELDRVDYDVVVSDMRMPQVDGTAVLRYAAGRSPQTVRIAMSGQTDMGAMLQTAKFAHLFITKPFDVSTLIGAIDRVRALHVQLDDPALRALIGGVTALPTAPSVFAALERAILSPDVGTDAIARIIAQDSGLAAKVLQLVNSSFFGLPRASTSIEHAVSYLGITVLRALVLSHEITVVFRNGRAHAFSFEEHETHALAVATLARAISRDRMRADEAFIAAILHDVGKVLLASHLPDRFDLASSAAMVRGVPLHVVERETVGVTHAEVGAYLLGLWGLPFSITEAVAHHHAPNRVNAVTSDDVLVAVHVANALVHELSDAEPDGADRLDMPFLERIGAAHYLPVWRQCAARQFEEAQSAVS